MKLIKLKTGYSFRNAAGLPDPQHYTTARDLATLTGALQILGMRVTHAQTQHLVYVWNAHGLQPGFGNRTNR